MPGGPDIVLGRFGISVCLSMSVVPLGEQQSEAGGLCWVEGAPQDIGVLVRRALGGPWTSGER